MLESNIGISTDQKEWGKFVDVASDTKMLIYFQLDSKGCELVRVNFPLPGPSIPDNRAITDVKTWRKNATAMKVLSPATGVGSPNKSVNGGDFSVSINNGFSGLFKLELDITTIKIEDRSTAACVVNYLKLDPVTEQYYKYADDDEFTVNITKILTAPEIEFFTTTKGAVIIGETFNLNWKVKNAIEIKLRTDISPTVEIKDEYVLTNAQTTYTLSAINLIGFTEASVTIYGGPNPSSGHIPASAKSMDGRLDGKLMNLISGGEHVMYALVMANQDVWLWTTSDGANWKKTAVSFNNKVPLEYAGSSGVFYNGKLFLIGGSRYDPNIRSNSVYFYDFTKPALGWQKDRNRDNDPRDKFSVRMGQGVVVVYTETNKIGEIYLMGGHGPNGTHDDMYTYNEDDGWTRKQEKLVCGLCMQNVIYDGSQIQMYGGFSGGPGTPDQKLSDFSYYAVGTKWERMDWRPPVPEPQMYKWEFVTCAAAVYNGSRFIFGIYRFGDELHHVTAKIITADMTLAMYQTAYFIPFEIYCLSVQAVTFKNAVWFSVVNDEGVLQSERLNYFLCRS